MYNYMCTVISISKVYCLFLSHIEHNFFTILAVTNFSSREMQNSPLGGIPPPPRLGTAAAYSMHKN